MKFSFLIMIFSLLVFQLPVHAQGCPAGTYPWSGNGVFTCLPDPNYNQQTSQSSPPPLPPGKWESRWGAIATDEPHGILGSATNMTSRRAAEKGAMSDCASKGGQNCKLETWYANSCAVLVVGDHVYNVTAESTLDKATDVGMRTCSAGGVTGCHVYFSACSLPVIAK